jgi:hypothetical protein
MAEIKEEKDRKKLRKEINTMKMKFRDIELRPCYGDEDLKKKDSDLTILRQEIYKLEKEVNQFPVFIPCLKFRA